MRALFLLFLSFSLFAQPVNIKSSFPGVTVQGNTITANKGAYITGYIASITYAIIGSQRIVKRVFKTLPTKKIDSDVVTLSEFDLGIETTTKLVKPNSLIIVIHSEPNHALNKYEVSNELAKVKFGTPSYEEMDDIVIANEKNILFIKKDFFDLDQVKKDPFINL